MSPLIAALASWRWDPLLYTLLLVTSVIYWRGWRHLQFDMPRRFPTWKLGCFLGAQLAILLAIASPLDTFASFLLSVHMAQHLLLLAIVPPLMWLSNPLLPLLRGLPRACRKEALGPFLTAPELQTTARVITRPIVCWIAGVGATISWHIPYFYDLGLRSPAWHAIEHLCFLAGSLLFWWPVFEPWPDRRRTSRWLMLPYLISADVVNSILSAYLVFSSHAVYTWYETVPRLWGSALSDQVTAGMLMWVPGSFIYLIAAAGITVRALGWSTGVRPSYRSNPAMRPALRKPANIAPRLRNVRPIAQSAMLLLAALVIFDGFTGPQLSFLNLAGVLPWTHWRGLAVLALLLLGNVFCFACPFTAPRTILRRWITPRFKWPAALRNKWIAFTLVALFFWSYEALRLWDSPWWTAWIIVAYFFTATLIDTVFEGASFCKYVCPIGQFHFVNSLASPVEVTVRDRKVCGGCSTKDCLRACETGLLQPAKFGNMDCTFCLACVPVCPTSNIHIAPATPIPETRTIPAALTWLITLGAFATAAAMTGVLNPALLLCLAPLALLLSKADKKIPATFVPLALTMWAAHFGYHLLTAGPMLLPAAGRFLHLTATFTHSMGVVPNWWPTLRTLLLDFGLLRTLYVQWKSQIAVPWMALALALYALGLWILAQPMPMRGMGDELMRALLLAVLFSPLAYPDGGTVEVRASAAPYIVTVFSDRQDLSILLQDERTLEPILDAEVSINTTDAALGAGTNKLLYSATVPPQTEPYRITIHRNGSITILNAPARPEIPPATPVAAISVVPCSFALFGLHQFLKRRRTLL